MKLVGLMAFVLFVLIVFLALYTWKVYGAESYYKYGGRIIDLPLKIISSVWDFFFTPKVVAVEVVKNG